MLTTSGYQVYVVASGSGDQADFGPVVPSLEHAINVVFDLDDAWEAGVDHPATRIYEGCDVYARGPNGETFMLVGGMADDSDDLESWEKI